MAEITVLNASNLYDNRETQEFDFGKIIKLDYYGRSVIDYPAAQKLFKERWQFLRYSLGQSGGRPLDENPKNPKRKMRWWRRDFNTGKYSFETTSTEDYLFGDTVQWLRERKHKRYLKKLTNEQRERLPLEDNVSADEHATAVLMKDVADQLHERLVHPDYHERWYVSQLDRMKELYSQYAAREMDVSEEGTKIKLPFFDKDDWKDILKAAHTSMFKIYREQVAVEGLRGLTAGAFMASRQILKSIFETPK